ncbi:PorV/PorQ family protein [bacterium]|nr:PorV/PorQ family protein [bacterium]
MKGNKHLFTGIALFVTILAAFPLIVYGTSPFEKVGTYSAQFLKLGVSARATGMGSAFTAIADDASALYWNPAGLVELERTEVTLNSVSWPADIDLYFVGTVFKTPYIPGTIGISVRALTLDPQIVRTIYRPEGTNRYFDAGSMSYGLSYAKYFTDRFSAGFTAHFLHMGLAERSVESWAFDFGLLYRIGIRGMTLGMMVQSLGSEFNFDERSSKLPTVFRVGLSVDLLRQGANILIASSEFSHPSDNAERMNVGAEYSFNQFFFVRGGYNINYDSQGLAWGVGFKIDSSQTSDIKFDYSWQDLSDLGYCNRVTLGFSY